MPTCSILCGAMSAQCGTWYCVIHLPNAVSIMRPARLYSITPCQNSVQSSGTHTKAAHVLADYGFRNACPVGAVVTRRINAWCCKGRCWTHQHNSLDNSDQCAVTFPQPGVSASLVDLHEVSYVHLLLRLQDFLRPCQSMYVLASCCATYSRGPALHARHSGIRSMTSGQHTRRCS